MILEESGLADWRKAGKISAVALDYGRKLIKKGALLIEVCNAVDAKIVELGARPSFPSQISLDHVAAHYCPEAGDRTILDVQVCKLDVGACVNGAMGDNAATVDLSGNYAELAAASEKALAAAIKVVKAGIALGEVGKVIQETIASYGFSPIRNLSGHGLGKFEIHTKPTVPNFDNGDKTQLQENEVIAIEPFATTGKGTIYESANAEVFMQASDRQTRDSEVRKVLERIRSYEKLPFAKRWLLKEFPAFKVSVALKILEQQGIIHGFPPLIEEAKGIVSQAEKTVLVKADGCEVLTEVTD
ncbi:type II methionyl aminopeptidase [Candidatus Woesearchaeota archaeon]|nr:type II methionyl aminopeptidase [Candidatus Woesearchaeota archaeon]